MRESVIDPVLRLAPAFAVAAFLLAGCGGDDRDADTASADVQPGAGVEATREGLLGRWQGQFNMTWAFNDDGT